MAGTSFILDVSGMDEIIDLMKEAENTEDVVNKVLHEYAGPLIADEIVGILPKSGRSWNGKVAAASSTMPFLLKKENLSVTVQTKTKYNYLYFPDDGSNTKKHAGNQHFMRKGGENKTTEILDRLKSELIKSIQGE